MHFSAPLHRRFKAISGTACIDWPTEDDQRHFSVKAGKNESRSHGCKSPHDTAAARLSCERRAGFELATRRRAAATRVVANAGGLKIQTESAETPDGHSPQTPVKLLSRSAEAATSSGGLCAEARPALGAPPPQGS